MWRGRRHILSYSKTVWADRNVQYPRRFTDQNSNVLTLTASPGTITAAGTPVSASVMNNIEDGIEDHDGRLDALETAGATTSRITPADYGCVMDGTTDDTTNFQAAVNAAIANNCELFLPPGYNIKLTGAITILAPISIVGGGAQTCLLTFYDCSGFSIAAGVIAVHMRGFTIQTAVAYTTTVNAHKGIIIAGDTSSRPYWCLYQDLVIIGFETAIEAQWIWASTFTTIQTAYCHKGLVIKGLSVNNKVDGNSQFSVDGSAGSRGIVIGDGTNEIEGWWLNQVMTYDADVGIELVGANHIYIVQPILDFCHSDGIYLHDGGGNFASNISVHGGYIAFSANGEAGIKLANDTDHAQIRGAEIIGVEIIAYTGSHFDYGILTSGTYCRNNIIGNNKIKNLDTAHVDIYMNGGGDNVIAGNVCLSPTPNPNNIYIAAGTGNKIYGNIGTCNVENAL